MKKAHHSHPNKAINTIVHIIENVIAVLTLLVLAHLICYEIYKMFAVDGYFANVDTYLNNVLTIVIGLEFVRMLVNLTPANTLEVLIVAIARQVILNHGSPMANIASVLCIAGLFAIRKFLISKRDLGIEMSEVDVVQEGDAMEEETGIPV